MWVGARDGTRACKGERAPGHVHVKARAGYVHVVAMLDDHAGDNHDHASGRSGAEGDKSAASGRSGAEADKSAASGRSGAEGDKSAVSGRSENAFA